MEHADRTAAATEPAYFQVELETGTGGTSLVEVESLDASGGSRLARGFAAGDRLSIRFRVPDLDTEGHAFATDEVVLDILLDDDDVEGHAFRLRFPSRDEAAAFRQSVMASGRLEGSMTRRQAPDGVALRPGVNLDMPATPMHRA